MFSYYFRLVIYASLMLLLACGSDTAGDPGAGDKDVAEVSDDSDLLNETLETVPSVPGPLAHVYTELEQDSIPAGTFTGVNCTGTDSSGNPLVGMVFLIQIPQQLAFNELDDREVGGVEAGVWSVTCVPASRDEATLHPATLEITALEPVGLELFLTPDEPAYQVGDQVTLGFTLVDVYGNPVPGGAIDIPVYEAEDGLIVKISHTVFTFVAEGVVTISSCITDDPTMCDEIEAWCDGTAPALSITSPERGVTLAGEPEVVVHGTIHEETSSLEVFTINGVDVVPAEDGSFEFTMTSAHGLNIIDAFASDAFGNEATTTRSYLFSSEYIPVDSEDPLVSLVDEAALVRLDDSLFISDDPSDEGTLSAIMQTLLAEMDLGELIPNPVVEDQNIIGCVYDLYIDDITYDDPVVTLSPVTGGIEMVLDLPNFHANFDLVTDSGILCLDHVGTFDASAVHFEALLVLTVTPDGFLDLYVVDPVTELTDLDVDLVGLSGLLLNWLMDWASGTLTTIIETLVVTQIQDIVDSVAADLNQSLADPFVLPIDGFFEGMPQVVLNALVRFDHSIFDQNGGELGVDLAIYSEKTIDRDPLGVLARADCNLPAPDVFSFDEDAAVELGGHVDVVNEALFALWWNGMFHQTITAEALAELGTDVSEYGLEDLILETGALLPPVITSCNPEGQLTLQLGDLYTEAEFSMLGLPADIHMYLFLEIDADLAVVDGEEGPEIGIEVHDPDTVLVDIVHVNDQWVGKEFLLTGLITDTLFPLLMEKLQTDPLSFPVPRFSLGELGSGGDIELPPKDLVLDLESVDMNGAYLHAKTGFHLEDTPPPEE